MKLELLAMMRNEAPVLREWIEHYLARGVTRIHLIDDHSTDGSRELAESVSELVTTYAFDLDDAPGRQVRAYNRVKLLADVDWLLVADLDEFIWSPSTVDLRVVCAGIPADFHHIKIPMIDFGDNGHVPQPPSVVPHFTRRRDIEACYIYKAPHKHLLRRGKITSLGNDRCRVAGGVATAEVGLKMDPGLVVGNLSAIRKLTDLRCNHYKLQSASRWRDTVVKRGSANAIEHLHHRHNQAFFNRETLVTNSVEDYGLYEQNKALGLYERNGHPHIISQA
jgi:hypothetical protein